MPYSPANAPQGNQEWSYKSFSREALEGILPTQLQPLNQPQKTKDYPRQLVSRYPKDAQVR